MKYFLTFLSAESVNTGGPSQLFTNFLLEILSIKVTQCKEFRYVYFEQRIFSRWSGSGNDLVRIQIDTGLYTIPECRCQTDAAGENADAGITFSQPTGIFLYLVNITKQV
jgi:hypothetical protein